MIELAQLRTFCAVIEKKSFTNAGEVVNRTQSTISTQISLLEKEYGEPLLNRFRKEVVPTESGKILYDYAKRIIKLIEESKEKISELKHVVSGDLTIEASTIPGTYILPEILKNFNNEYPEVNISLGISNSETVISRILEHTVEIGVVGDRINNDRLEYMELVKDRIILVIPPDHKWAKRRSITLDELKNEKFVLREEGSGTKTTVEAELKRKGIKRLNVVLKVGNTEAIKESVKAGMGLSFISEWAIKDNSLIELNVRDLNIARNFYIVFRKGSVKKNSVQAFLDFIKSMQLRRQTL